MLAAFDGSQRDIGQRIMQRGDYHDIYPRQRRSPRQSLNTLAPLVPASAFALASSDIRTGDHRPSPGPSRAFGLSRRNQ